MDALHFNHLHIQVATVVPLSQDLLESCRFKAATAANRPPTGCKDRSKHIAGVLAPDGGVHDRDVSGGDRGADNKAVPGIPQSTSPFLATDEKNFAAADEQDDKLSPLSDGGVGSSFGGTNGEVVLLLVLLLFTQSSLSVLKIYNTENIFAT